MTHFIDSLPLPETIKKILYQKQGPLTRDLLRKPGEFGLGQVPATKKPDATTTAVCGYCGTGCGLNLHLQQGEAISLTPKTSYPVNLGMACPKGWESLTVLDAPDRATTPLLKNKQGNQVPVNWDVAMTEFSSRFKEIQQKHGNDSVAFLSTGQIPIEEMAFFGALAKFGMGMTHGDGNTRQCMATAVVAYKEAFGFDAPPYTYQDFEESDTIILIGSNLCIAHPILWERVMRNRHDPQIVVIDPRMTETAMSASEHLAITPKSDMALLYGTARILIENEWIERHFIEKHTNDFSQFEQYVKKYDLEYVAKQTGLEPQQIINFAQTIYTGKRVSFWWTMGVNQSYQGVRTAQAIINLALMTGNIGKPGTGANSITGQCNAMGSRLFSNTSNMLGGHDFTNPQHREKIAGILDIDEKCIPRENSWAYHEIMEGILKGKIKGLWIVGTNPAHSWINQGQAKDILERLDFLVVQDMFNSTATTKMADLVLPAAGWGEKEGCQINSERRISRVKKVRKAPGDALSDFNIFKLVAHYWGCSKMFEQWKTPEAVFQLLKQCTASQPCDITGIEDYAMIEKQGGIQWPYPTNHDDDRNQRRLFEENEFFTEDKRAKFIFEEPRGLSEPLNENFPFLLMTGRGSASQWHTQTKTRNSAVLRKLYPEKAFTEINPADAKSLGISQNDLVTVSSQRGSIRCQAFLTHAVQRGQLFIPMHYEDVNQLTDAVFDPYSKQPSYKACAVTVTRCHHAGV